MLWSIVTVGQYEWRRALARKKVSLLVLFTILIEFLPFLVLTLLPLPTFLLGATTLMWYIGALAPHLFFLQFTALMLASGATAEEYEQGTTDLILSKPLSRVSYLLGKYLGGISLLSLLVLLTTLLAIILSTITFGRQTYLEYSPLIFASIVISTLVFFSIGFSVGELFRSPGLAYLVSSSIFLTSFLLVPFLVLANALTGDLIYLEVGKALPTWAVQRLPSMVAEEFFLRSNTLPSGLFLGPQIVGTLPEALLRIFIYSAVTIALAFVRITRTDVTRKSTE